MMRRAAVPVVLLVGLVAAAPAAQAAAPSAAAKRSCTPPTIEDTTVTALRFERFRVAFTGGAGPGCATARSVARGVLLTNESRCFTEPTAARTSGAGPFTARCRVLGYACFNRGVFGGADVSGSVRCSRIVGRTKTVIKFSYDQFG